MMELLLGFGWLIIAGSVVFNFAVLVTGVLVGIGNLWRWVRS
jgi:hypothetical protein